MKIRISHRSQTALLGAALFLIVVAVFSPVRHFEFINHDDDQYVFDNPHIAHGLTLAGVRWAFTAGLTYSAHADYWQPLTFLSRMLDIEFFGLNPAGHHMTNLFLHATNALLLYFLLAWLSGARGKSFFVALLFAIYPVQIESVAWVTARKDLLSGFFILLTLFAYAYSHLKKSAAMYICTLFLYLFALLSKPLPMFPILLLLFDYWPLQRYELNGDWQKKAKSMLGKIPFFILSAITLIALKSPVFVSFANSVGQFAQRCFFSYGHYLRSLIYPLRVGIYGPSAQPLPPVAVGWVIAFFLIMVSYLITQIATKRRVIFFGWFWLIVGLFPTTGFVYPADRYLYLPMVGLAVILVWGIAPYFELNSRRHKWGVIIAALVLTILTGFTSRQLEYWRNNKALFRRALEINSRNYVAHNNMGNIFGVEGKFDEAIYHFQKCLNLNPHYARAYVGLGVVTQQGGDDLNAMNLYREAIRQNPNLPIAHSNLGNLLLTTGAIDQAILAYMAAIQLDPFYYTSHLGLGNCYLRKGQWQNAAAQFSQALRIEPDAKPARQGLSFAKKKIKYQLIDAK